MFLEILYCKPQNFNPLNTSVTNQLTGFYMKATLEFNSLNRQWFYCRVQLCLRVEYS